MLKTLLLSLAMSAALLASSMVVYASGTTPRAPIVATTHGAAGR